MRELANTADLQVYGPGDPAPEDVDAFWREVDDIVGEMKGSTTVWQRLRARLSLRSLRPALAERAARARRIAAGIRVPWDDRSGRRGSGGRGGAA